MKIQATEAHLERAIPAVKADREKHCQLCLFAQAINDAVAPAHVIILCPSSGILNDTREFYVPGDTIRPLMQAFDNSDYVEVVAKLPFDFEIEFKP